MTMKRFISVFLVLIMVITCGACGKANSQSEDELYHNVDFSKDPTTITYLTIGDKPVNGMTEEVIDRINEILRKKVNAELDIYYVGWDDYLSHYNSILDSTEINPDLVATGTDWLDAWPNVFKGNFLPMSEEMIRTYCPQTYKNVSEKQWEICSYKGDIYFIPENEYSQWTNHGFIYRSDIAKDAGLESIDSWKDLRKYVDYVVNNRPDLTVWDTDGSNTIVTLGYLMSASRYIPIYEISTYGLWGADAGEPDKIISPYYEGNDLIDFARIMKTWNEQGVWKPDFLSYSGSYKDFLEGNAALEQHHTQNYYTEIKPVMELRQPGTDAKFFWFGKESGNLLRTSILHGAMAVYSGSKNPEKALMVYDILRNDEECYRLLRYGIEGVQYEINDEGMMEMPSGYNAERDEIVTNFWWGRRDELEIRNASYAWDDYDELVQEYEEIAVDYPWDGIAFDTTGIVTELQDVISVCEKYVPEITYGRYECDPKEEVEEFRRELKAAGFEIITAKLQRILDTY